MTLIGFPSNYQVPPAMQVLAAAVFGAAVKSVSKANIFGSSRSSYIHSVQ